MMHNGRGMTLRLLDDSTYYCLNRLDYLMYDTPVRCNESTAVTSTYCIFSFSVFQVVLHYRLVW